MQPDAFRFDSDAALALQVHRGEHLLVHLALAERAGHFQQTVSQRGLAVVNVRDDAEIAYEPWIHFCLLTAGAAFHFPVPAGRNRRAPPPPPSVLLPPPGLVAHPAPKPTPL